MAAPQTTLSRNPMPTAQWSAPTTYTAPSQGSTLSGGSVGNLNWYFGPEFERYQQELQGQAQEAANVAAQDLARIGGSGGFARSQMAIARGATEGQRLASQALMDTQKNDLTAQGLRLQDLSAAEQARQFGASLGENSRQFDASFGLESELGRGGLDVQRQQLALQKLLGMGGLDVQRQQLALQQLLGMGGLDIDRARLGLDRDQLALQGELGRGELDLAAQRLGLDRDQLDEMIRQFGLEFGEQGRQFDLGYLLDRDRLNQQGEQFGQGLQSQTLQNLISSFTSLGLNPADYADVLNQLSRGDYSYLANNAPISAPQPTSGATSGYDMDEIRDLIERLIDDSNTNQAPALTPQPTQPTTGPYPPTTSPIGGPRGPIYVQ